MIMKQLRKFRYVLMAMAVLLCAGFVSCSEETNEQMIYSVGFDSFSSSSSGTELPLGEMSAIQGTFYEELGITTSIFEMEGSAAECDAKVKAACERAVTRLKQQTWKSKFVFKAYNAITEQDVFLYSYPETSSN